MNPYLMLAVAEGFGENCVPALLAPDVDPERFLAEPPEPPAIPPRVAERIRSPTLRDQARRIGERAAEHQLAVLHPGDSHWPERLAAAPLRPLVLFVRGDPSALARDAPIAVVGSRTPTPYGSDAAANLAGALASTGTTLWSGLARGIDGIVHAASVSHATPGVAVLAGGLDTIYPPEHGDLAARLERAGGCLVSELPPGRRARRGHFPRRNRLLALSTRAVVVVEASLSSGALHTARFAAEYGTDVFAVPGPWNSERSQGCHRLIAEGAAIVEDPAGLLRSLGIDSRRTGAEALHVVHSADERCILHGLARGPRPADLVLRETGLDRGAFLRSLFALESRGAVERLAGDLLRATSR